MFDPGDVSFSRRRLLAGMAAAGLVGTAQISPAAAKAQKFGTQAPAFYRFAVGGIQATIISDGPLALGPPGGVFKGVTAEEMGKQLAGQFLPADALMVDQNALVLNTGSTLVLFDTGMGYSKAFGPTAGRLIGNLRAAEIDPKDVDAVVLTHAHPDHCWGLLNESGARNFPNAQIYMSEADLAFWTDEGKLGMAPIKAFIEGTRAQLLPNRDRIVFVKDGQEFLPGIQAMAAPGHTVGHTIFMITSQGQTFCYSADVTHHHVLTYANPRAQFVFDTDPQQAIATRLKVLDMLATDRTPFLAYHLPWPGVGHVQKQGEAYRFIPSPMRMVL